MAQASNQQVSNQIPYFDSVQFGNNEKSDVFHAFFGRQGGCSRGVYNSLNVGRGSDDSASNVNTNIQLIANQTGVPHENIVTLHQVHSNICRYVSGPWEVDERPQADALVSDKAGLAIGVLTADCAPVLFLGEKSNKDPVIGAAHAGWKGAVSGVLDNTVRGMVELGADINTIRACVGPCIAQGSYEVSEAFFEPFNQDDPENERFFMAGQKSGHLMFDLAGYCAARLARNGIKQVFIKDLDTYFNEEDFYSYRRATHRSEKDYGRQISLICIKNKE